MSFLEIIKFVFLFAAVVLLIIGFANEPEIVKLEKAAWRRFRVWLAAKLRSWKKFMMWLNDEKTVKAQYVCKVTIINDWRNERY